MKVIGIDMVQLHVRDWEDAVKWYQEKLSCEVLFREDEHRFCLMRLGESPCQLALYGVAAAEPEAKGRCIPCIRVEGLREMVDTLRARSVSISADIFGGDQEDAYRMATITDLEGNPIHLYEWTQPA